MTDYLNPATPARRAMITSSFQDRETAERAYADLRSRGYGDKDIHVLMSDDTRKHHFNGDVKLEHGNMALSGAGLGSVVGGAVGVTLLGMLAGAGIPEDHAKIYETDLKAGSIVLGVTPRHDEDASYFEKEWRASGQHVYR